VNTGALLNRLNFALTFAGDRMAGTNIDLSVRFVNNAATSAPVALSRAVELFLNGQIADTTRSTLQERLDDPQIFQGKPDDPARKVNAGLISGLVLGAPEYQRR
jgi:hypothetical protein